MHVNAYFNDIFPDMLLVSAGEYRKGRFLLCAVIGTVPLMEADAAICVLSIASCAASLSGDRARCGAMFSALAVLLRPFGEHTLPCLHVRGRCVHHLTTKLRGNSHSSRCSPSLSACRYPARPAALLETGKPGLRAGRLR